MPFSLHKIDPCSTMLWPISWYFGLQWSDGAVQYQEWLLWSCLTHTDLHVRKVPCILPQRIFHLHLIYCTTPRDAADLIQSQLILYRPSQAHNFLSRMLTIFLSNFTRILLFDVICWNGFEVTPTELSFCDDTPHMWCVAQLSLLYCNCFVSAFPIGAEFHH